MSEPLLVARRSTLSMSSDQDHHHQQQKQQQPQSSFYDISDNYDGSHNNTAPPGVIIPKEVKRQVWRCDVCQVKTFFDFQEACDHETGCREKKKEKGAKRKQGQRQAKEETTTTKAALHPFFNGNDDLEEKDERRTKHRSMTTRYSSRRIVGKDEKQKKDDDHHRNSPTRKNNIKKRDSKVVEISQSSSEDDQRGASAVVVIIEDESGSSPEPINKKMKPSASLGSFDIFSKKKKTSRQTKLPSNKSTKRSAFKTSTTAAKKVSLNAAPLASIFTGQTGNHGKNKNKQKMRQDKTAEPVVMRERPVYIKPRAPSAAVMMQKPKRKRIDRFPVPNHVGCHDGTVMIETGSRESAESTEPMVVNKKQLHQCRRILAKHYPEKTAEEETVASYKHPMEEKTRLSLRESQQDECLQILATILRPPKARLDDHGLLWTDKYSIQSIPSDVCGERNQSISESLLGFVEDWKVKRKQAHNIRAERQKKLLQGKKKRRSKRKLYCDGFDNENDEDEDQYGLRNICLLTGSIGSGKTSLVHAIAKQAGCSLIEINTTMCRGGQALKHAVEEATQSDSTLDMLKKKSAVTTVFFSQQHNEEEDSDVDEDEQLPEGSAVPIILIDEVDIMFEEDGDTGFWYALKNLAKKAKCPIFLTSSTVPEESCALNLRHFELTTPKPYECVSKIWKIIQAEQFRKRKGSSSDDRKPALEKFADYCQGDVRRMINILQLFSFSQGIKRPVVVSHEVAETASQETKCSTQSCSISSVTPKLVPHNEMSLVRVRGQNFGLLRQSEIEVHIGDQVCPVSKIIDESTIFAICPPLQGCDKSKVANVTRKISEVLIREKGGRIMSGPLVSNEGETVLGSPSTSVSRINIEYDCDDGDSDDMDTEENTLKESGSQENRNNTRVKGGQEVDLSVAQKMIDDETICCSHSDSQVDEIMKAQLARSESSSINELEKIAMSCQDESDFLFIEDHAELPWLAGACPGFGQAYTDGSIPSNDTNTLVKSHTSKPPPFDRIFSSGWNDEYNFFGQSDTLVTYPRNARERKLMWKTAALCRGSVHSLSLKEDSKDEESTNEGEEGGVMGFFNGSSQIKAVFEEDAFLLAANRHLPRELTAASRCLLEPSSKHLMDSRKKFTSIKNNSVEVIPNLAAILPESYSCSLFSRGTQQSKEGVLLSPTENMSHTLILEYKPLVSLMCFHERAFELTHQEMIKDREQSSSGRRTRRSRMNRRVHYFENWNKHSYNEDVKHLGDALAGSMLI